MATSAFARLCTDDSHLSSTFDLNFRLMVVLLNIKQHLKESGQQIEKRVMYAEKNESFS